MKKQLKNKAHDVILTNCILFLVCLVSCKKNVEPLVNEVGIAYVNFYNASEVLNRNQQLRYGNMIYVNDSVPTELFKYYPEFNPLLDDNRQYPDNVYTSGIPDVVVIPQGMGFNVFYWLPIKEGKYRFTYTSSQKVYLKDIALQVNATKKNAQYLAESPEADNAYRVISVPEEWRGTAGKVRVRFVHLGTDAGSLDIKRETANGANEIQGLPQGLSFANYSDYIELDTIGVSKTGNVIPLNIYSQGNSEILLSPAIPPLPGASFVVVLQGFRKAAIRRIKIGENNGSDEYSSVAVQPNFRVNIRRSF